ncbi:MAG: hypothetical protein WC875_05440 [Candidatus Absconditabacterales bacterium]|jgi:hypothetical protein
MKKIIMIIGMVIVFSTSCFAQVKNMVAAIEDKQNITVSLTTDQSRLQQHDTNSLWAESQIMCKSLKDSLLANLLRDGYKARLGFILAAVKNNCPLVIKSENQDVFCVTSPKGNSYIVVIERVGNLPNLSTQMYCDLEQDWQVTFKDIYGYDYFSPTNK